MSQKVAPVGLGKYDQDFLSKDVSQSYGYVLTGTCKTWSSSQVYRLREYCTWTEDLSWNFLFLSVIRTISGILFYILFWLVSSLISFFKSIYMSLVFCFYYDLCLVQSDMIYFTLLDCKQDNFEDLWISLIQYFFRYSDLISSVKVFFAWVRKKPRNLFFLGGGI